MPTIGDLTTTTALNAYLKVMQGDVTKHFNDETLFYGKIAKATGRKVGGGRLVELPQHIWPNRNIAGVRGDAGNMAKASRGRRELATVPVYAHNTTGSFGHIAELKTKADVQSLQSVIEAVVEDIKIGYPQQLNKLLFLDGSGCLAEVDSAAALTATTFGIDEEGTGALNLWGAHYLEPGMWIQATSDVTAADPDRTTDAQIVSFDGTNIFTIEGNIGTLADGDAICLQDGLNNVTEGLLSAVSDGSTAPDYASTYLGIDRTAAGNEYWQANRSDMGGTGTIEDELVTMMTTTQKRAGRAPKEGVTSFEVYNNIFFQSKSSAARQFIVEVGKGGADRKYALGYSSLDVQTQHGMFTLFGDKDCPDETIIGYDPKDFLFVQTGEQGWYKGQGGNMYHEVGGTYGIEVNWLWVMNFICKRPMGQFRISNVPVS